jgi:DeoR/GlpR family transcriptional regulator of sugar metabolism
MNLHLDERKLKILELLSGRGVVSVKEMSNNLNVTEATIRTDLDTLAGIGKVVRIHGGAKIIENRIIQEYTYQTRKSLNSQNKKEIGKIAAGLVNSQDSILLDSSTTALAMAHALRNREELKDVTIIPTGIWTSIELMGYDNFNVLLPGGYLRHTTGSITGLSTMDFFNGLIIQKAFLGAWGVTSKNGLTDTHLLEIELKKNIISRVKEIIILVDGSKFNQSGLASYAKINQAAKIITDYTAPINEIKKIRKMGVEVLVTKQIK